MDSPLTADAVPAPEPDEAAAAQPSIAALEGGLRRDRVVIGASAGGLSALKQLVSMLPADYRGALCIVVHIAAGARSQLAEILAGRGPLPARVAEDGMPIESGCIYVAPPDAHLLVERERLAVTHGPRENRHRPAIDPLFRSAAWAFGPRTIGIVLSGNLDDGTAGLWAIKSCGGTTVVQDPAEAEHPDMPSNALLHNRIDHRLPVADIAPLIVRLGQEPLAAQPAPPPPAGLHSEIGFSRGEGDMTAMARLGTLTAFTCPSCRGALWELDEGGHLRYRCHTGHAFTHASLMVDQSTAIEESLYAALRAVEEKAAALRRLAERWADRFPQMQVDYLQRADEMDRSADVLRHLLAGHPVPSAG